MSKRNAEQRAASLWNALVKLLGDCERRRQMKPRRHIQADRKAKGLRWCSQPPLGFRWVRGKLAPNPEERDIMSGIVLLREAGQSWDQIARKLLLARKLDKSGSTVRRMFFAEMKLRVSEKGGE